MLFFFFLTFNLSLSLHSPLICGVITSVEFFSIPFLSYFWSNHYDHFFTDLEVTEQSSASDVFRVVFSAMATLEPWRSLLLHAIVLRNPLFAELAACCVRLIISGRNEINDTKFPTLEPWKSLPLHAIVLSNPLFVELAACCVNLIIFSLKVTGFWRQVLPLFKDFYEFSITIHFCLE